MGDDDYSSLEIEIETLKAIYIHELEVNHDDRGRPNCVIVHLYPATADNVTEQFVRLSLILCIPSEYPLDIPEISIRNTRGLSDEEIESLYQATQTLAEERKGNAMLFELIEVAKEHLTGINIPSCECAICLYGFVNDDVLTKTDCFHYFHSHCLSRYVDHTLKGKDVDERFAEDSELDTMIACPVCRLPVSFSLSDKKFPPPTESEKVDISISLEQRKLQEEMQELFIKQKEKGGIIDLEAERNRFLLEISNVPDSTANNNNIETVNQQIEQCGTEHGESHAENLVKTANIGSEVVSESEENHLEENNEDKNKYSKQPIINQHKQHGTISNKSERHLPLEKNLECINSTEENSNIQQNENRKQILAGSEEQHTSDAVVDVQQEKVISQGGRRYRPTQRGKMPYRGPNKRHFRGNRYPRQIQNRERYSYDKRMQNNQYEDIDEMESYLPKQSSADSTDEHIDRVLDSREDSSEIKSMETDKRPKSSRIDTDIYRERKNENRLKYFGRNSKKYQTEEREYSREKKNEFIEEENDSVKNTDSPRRTAKGDRKFFYGKYSRNYRSEQRFRNDFQRVDYVENTQNKGHTFQDKNANGQNTEYKSSKNEMRKDNKTVKESYMNDPLENDMPQNHNRSKQHNMEDSEYPIRDQSNENIDSKFSNSGPRLEHNRSNASSGRKFRQNSRNVDHNWTGSRSSTNVVSLQEDNIQKMERLDYAECNESEFEVTPQLLNLDSEGSRSEERFKTVNTHDNSYRGKYNNRRGFRSRANNRQYSYNEGRENYNSKSFSEQENFEHKSSLKQTQIASKNKVNKEISKPSFGVQETAIQSDSQFNETEPESMLKPPSKNEEYEYKDTNSNDRSSYRGKPRSHRGYRYWTNERCRFSVEAGKTENRDDKRQLSEQMGQPQNSTNLILVETNEDGEENTLRKDNRIGNNVDHTVPRTSASKSTKQKNLYFYPKSRGNYRNNNRTANEGNYNTQERHRDSKGSNVLRSSNDKVESVDTTFNAETKEITSHR